MKITRVWILLALFSLGCDKGNAKDDEGKAAIATSASPAANSPASAKKGGTYAAPESWTPKPFAVGQWVLTRTTRPGEPPARVAYRIVGKEGNDFWFEVESNSQQGTVVIQVLLDPNIRQGLSRESLKKARMKTGNAPTLELTGPMLAAASKSIDGFLGGIGKPDLGNATRADVTVPAGTFQGCFVHDYTAKVLGISSTSKVWNHPSVPVLGFVRSEGEVNGKTTVVELIEMHDEGAKSAL